MQTAVGMRLLFKEVCYEELCFHTACVMTHQAGRFSQDVVVQRQ